MNRKKKQLTLLQDKDEYCCGPTSRDPTPKSCCFWRLKLYTGWNQSEDAGWPWSNLAVHTEGLFQLKFFPTNQSNTTWDASLSESMLARKMWSNLERNQTTFLTQAGRLALHTTFNRLGRRVLRPAKAATTAQNWFEDKKPFAFSTLRTRKYNFYANGKSK